MVWGFIVTFFEGRPNTDFVLAISSCSFVVASGIVKDVGLELMDTFKFAEGWLPAATGAVFTPFLLVSLFAVYQIPIQSVFSNH
jgi:hypothetical protein